METAPEPPAAHQSVVFFEFNRSTRDRTGRPGWPTLSHHGSFAEAVESIAASDVVASIQKLTVTRTADGLFYRDTESAGMRYQFASDDELYVRAVAEVRAMGGDVDLRAARMAEMRADHRSRDVTG